MATEYVRVYRIAEHPADIEPGQISLMSSPDTELGFRAMGHKDHAGNPHISLAKDEIARVLRLDGTVRMNFSDQFLAGADSGGGMVARFADSIAEADAYLGDFGDVSMMAAIKYILDNTAGVGLNEAYHNERDVTVNDGGVYWRVPTGYDSVVSTFFTQDPEATSPTVEMYNNGSGPTMSFIGEAGVSDAGHLLKTLNGRLSLHQRADTSAPFPHHSESFCNVHRKNSNPDLCHSVAEVRAQESIGGLSAQVQAAAWCGVDGAGGGNAVSIGGNTVFISGNNRIALNGRVTEEIQSWTAQSEAVTLSLDTDGQLDLICNNQESITVTLTEPPDSPTTTARSMGVVRIIQGGTTSTTSFTWVSSGGASVTWRTPQSISTTLGSETYVEIWWDYLKWSLVTVGAGGDGVSGLSPYQILFGDPSGGISQSSDLVYTSVGDISLSGGSLIVGGGEGIRHTGDIYHDAQAIFSNGIIAIETKDTTFEGGNAAISLKARESEATTKPQIEIVSGGSYSGEISGTLDLRGYSVNIEGATDVDFLGSELVGVNSVAIVEQAVSSSSGFLSVSLNNGANIQTDVDENITTVSFQVPIPGSRYELRLTFTGSYTVTGFSGFKWAGASPPISGTSGEEYIVTFEYKGSDGYYAIVSGPFS